VHDQQKNIGVLTSYIEKASNTPINNLVGVLQHLHQTVFLISGGDVSSTVRDDPQISIHTVEQRFKRSALNTIVNYCYGQIKSSILLAKLSPHITCWIFFIGGERMILPMITAKLLRKPVFLMLPGSITIAGGFADERYQNISRIITHVTRGFSDAIIIYSPTLIHEYRLEKYRNKIVIGHEHFLNLTKYSLQSWTSGRKKSIGYIGRLSQEKGILNFMEAVSGILDIRHDVSIYIAGDGILRPQVEQFTKEHQERVEYGGWIPSEDLPKRLDALRLLVIPSFTEGLPNILLEAMACGTPVLAAPVGMIPEVIENGVNGFLLEDNSRGTIARHILEILDREDLDTIARNGRATLEKRFTLEATVKEWQEILRSLPVRDHR
jgi:glycosyltransferase involved in cell wall biosynthesis